MAPGGKRGSSTAGKTTKIGRFKKTFKLYWKKLNFLGKKYSIPNLLCDHDHIWIVGTLLILAEFFLNIFIIQKVPYTEIDWKAYMQQVDGFLNGTYNYTELKGDTGPLVYPAGHVYIFTALYYLTKRGSEIFLAQYYFMAFYLLTLILVFRIYAKSRNIQPYCLIILCCTSYRIHSIFVLRLFNDPVATLLLLAAVNCFVSHRWTIGCALFSLAVSVKMNILLFAPALFFILLSEEGFKKTIRHIFLCGLIQVILALPFLICDPVAYIGGAFNLGRIFLFQWTVNWRFLPEEIFLHRYFHVGLLVLHVTALLIFSRKWIKLLKLQTLFGSERSQLNRLTTNQILLPLFTANVIGIAFSRSLHYQFYVWYYHTLCYLVWSISVSLPAKLGLLGLIELAWNTYPSTVWSSVLLHLSHLTMLIQLYRQPIYAENRKAD